MQFRFLHVSDVHLGFRQYNESFRASDFAQAFRDVIDRSIAAKVDFVIIGGDLFHKRAIDAQTLDQAFRRLELLKHHGIPCIAIEGNHEMAYYGEEGSWLGFLRARGLITLLQTDFAEGVASFAPLRNGRGGWFDPMPGVRVYGLGYKGAGTPAAVEMCALALDALPPDAREGVAFTIFAAHTGVLGELPGDALSPTLHQWMAMRPHTDYVALGHIHKPSEKDDWLYNPGSLETCAANEWAWNDRAALLVEVDTDKAPGPERTRVTRIKPERRPFARFQIKTDLHGDAEALETACTEKFTQRRAEMGVLTDDTKPMVDIILDGVLGFEQALLNLHAIEESARSILEAAHVQVKNFAIPKSGARIDPDHYVREDVERGVFVDLLAKVTQFADNPDEWASVAITVKNMANVPEPPERIVDELATMTQAIADGTFNGHPSPADLTAEETGVNVARVYAPTSITPAE